MSDEQKLHVELRCSGVVFQEDRILLVRHIRGDGSYWVLPGGGPLEGEVATSAVEREILEETGLPVRARKVLFVWEGIPSGESDRTLELVFQAELLDRSGEPKSSNPEEEPRFVSIEDAGALDLYPPVAGCLRGAWRQRFEESAPYLGNMWRSMKPSENLPAGS
jgi:ADP-ribose pyrophosphatase YjhB (NUDIX family)